MKNTRVFNKIMSVVLALVMVLSMLPMSVFATEATQTDVDVGETTAVEAVAKVGNTEYATIDEAVANWTNGSTLTLLSNVTLSDVIKLKSTEHHTLNLGTYTMTAASGKNAIEITCNGRSSASYALTVNADVNNPGGITATGKACIYYSKSDSTKDRPIIRIYNGVFNGSYSINSKSNGNTNCTQIWIYGGTFNGNVNLTKNMLRVFGGTFNGWINCTGDQSAYREISGGRFKSWQFMTADADTKFWVGTSKANYDVGLYVDDNGYLVVGGDVITEAGDFEAYSANYGGWSSYLKYSSAKDNGLYYTSVEEALADNNKTTGSVTVYVDELNMTDSNYKGTIVVPEGKTITIVAVADTTPTWKVEGAVTYVDTSGNELVRGEDGSFAVPASNVAEVNGVGYATLEEAFAAAAESDTITLLADATPALTSQRAITKAAVIDLGGKTLTLTEDDLYFGTTTFKNGSIVVDPSVRPSTAVFWMFANQTLTFDNVKLTATGVTGTYLIGLDGNNSDLNLINGSEIIVENTTALDLDIICVNASTGNDILIADSKVSVTNLDGRVFFRGNYTVSGTSDIDLSGITKAGFRIEAGQTLSIEDTATVDIVGEPRDGGIHLTDVTAAYTKADTATVNATVNAPTPAYVAEINGVGYATLQAAIDAVQAGDEIVLLADVAETVTTPNGITLNGNGFTIDGTVTAGGNLTFVGHTKVTSFSAGFYDHTVTIGEGACLEVTSTGRVTLGYGNVFNITGSIENAKTADKSAVAPSLIIPGGISITGGNDAEMNVTNAYIKLGNTSSKNSAANGTFEVNFTNSIVEFTNQFTLSQPTNGNTPTFKVNVKDSVMTLVAKLCIYAPDTEFVVDNSKVSTANNLHNSGELILKNGSELTASMIQFGENGGNDGTITVDASTLTINNNNSAHAMDGNNVGKLVLKNGGTAKVDYIVETKIEVDGTDFSGEPKLVLTTKNLADATNTVTVIGAAYEITAEGLVLKEKTLSGKGTEAEPFVITTLDDLILFRDSVNAGETKYNAPGVYVALDADIDMAGTDWSVNIGDDCNATFDGIFDGKGHTISNLTATETAAKTDGYVCTGLFGAIYGSAVIKNLTIKNVTINTGDFTGNNAAAVVGFAYSCTGSVENVKVTGDIKINAKNVTGTGAIVGYDYYGKLTVKDCSVKGNNGSYIKGAAYVGGVIGYASTNSNVSGNTVENVAITAQCCVGGVAGIMLNNGKAEGNTVKNVTLTATHKNWQNSAAAVVGAISGGTVTVSGTTVENVNTAALVGANMTEEHPSAPVEKVEAAIGNTYYGTLEAAINAAKGQTITLLVPYVVEAGETVTLDLKGQTVVMEKAEKVTANHAMILNKGNLTIKDSVGGGKLTYQYTGENLGATYAVTTITSNPGSTLTVEGGTIENLTYDNSIIAYAIDGLTNGGLGDVTVNINGGTIIGLRQAVRIFANSTTNTGTLNITGGDITGRVIVQNANANANKAVLEITGGTFNANSYKTEVMYVGGSNGAGMAIDATVSGGTFKGEVASSVPNGFITDGTFKSDVTAFCAEGYTCEQNADGTWGVSEVELAEFRGAAVDMGNTLNMNFYISKNNFNGEGYYVEMISGDTTKTVEMADWLASGSDYVFIYDGLAAKQMCDEIKVTVYDADGKQVSKTWTDSIRAYVDRMWDKQTGDEIRTLFVDMLNYGAAAQGHFTYNTDDLANSWLTEEQQDYATVRVECLNTRVKTDNCIGTAFQLESNISMNLYFSGVTSDMYAEVTFTHHNEIEQTKVRIEGTEFNRDGSNTVITVDEIVVADGRQPVTCTVFDADGNEVASVTDSLESYVNRMGGSYPWLYEVMKFSDSAYNFLH